MLSNYSSFLEISAGIYASICFDDILNNIWSSHYYKRLNPIFKGISINSYSKLSEKLIEENQEWVLTLKKPMIRRATLMFLIVFFSSIYIGFEEELQADTEFISQLRTSLVATMITILVIFYGLLRRIVFAKWKYFIVSFAFIVLIGVLSYLGVSLWGFQCNFCNKYFSPIFISFILLPLIAQLVSSWVYYSLYIGYVRDEIYLLLEDYYKAVKMLEQKNKESMPKEYAGIFIAQILRDSDNANDTCVELFNNHLFDKITAVTKPNGVWEILISWVRYKCKGSPRKKPVHEQYYNEPKTSPQYPIPEQVLFESRVKLELDYSKEYKEFHKWKKSNKKLDLKEFCKQHNYKFEEMKIWLEHRNLS